MLKLLAGYEVGFFCFFFFFPVSLSYVRPGTTLDLTGRVENEDPEDKTEDPL